jgi:hypothetical protein
MEVTVSSQELWIELLPVGVSSSLLFILLFCLLCCFCGLDAIYRALGNACVMIFISVASGRFAPKQRKGSREADAGHEGGSFAINVDDARFSSIFTGASIPALLEFAFLTFAAQIQIMPSTPSTPCSSAPLACSRFCTPLSPNASNPRRSAAAQVLLQPRPLLQGA